jgi:hypothetical protein
MSCNYLKLKYHCINTHIGNLCRHFVAMFLS